MNWRTELFVKASENKINLSQPIFTIGSCFSDEIGDLLSENKFVVSQPFGTVYNPISIHKLLQLGLRNTLPDDKSYSTNEDIYFNYHFHSSFSALSRADLDQKVQKAISEANQFLRSSNFIIITYGTAFVYELKNDNLLVANCHRIPATNFIKRLLIESEIVKSFEKIYNELKTVNPQLKIILTVSPVRHLKDTLELNSVSKSILRTACHSIINRFKDVEYFPSYEILLDDLRDYRFYKSDLLHPTKEAVIYIWEKFIDAYFDQKAKSFVSEWDKIKSELGHRPFSPDSEGHQKFLRSLLLKLENLQQQIDVSKEIENVKSYFLNRTS